MKNNQEIKQAPLPQTTVTADTIGRKLPDGSYEKEFFQQGYIFKSFANFQRKKGVCYIPELSDKKYTYEDFLYLCGGNNVLAEYVFETVDWQHPESFIDGDFADIGVLPCEVCAYLYDTQEHEHCPRCEQ